jgi:hypothetical protein
MNILSIKDWTLKVEAVTLEEVEEFAPLSVIIAEFVEKRKNSSSSISPDVDGQYRNILEKTLELEFANYGYKFVQILEEKKT